MIPFHLLAKPSGSACNLDCAYCFFLSKAALYPQGDSRMADATLAAYLRQLLDAHPGPVVTVAWQGGEPTLIGLDFFRRAVALAEQYRRPGQQIEHTLQTNGVLLDDEWCAFLKANNFLVGISLDGPPELHDAYRRNRGGQGTFDQARRGWERLRQHGVDANILCTVNAANQDHGRRVYRFFRDELGGRHLQFIPIVERATAETLAIANEGWHERPGGRRPLYTQSGSLVTSRSVGGEPYGRFLVDIYEEWIRRDVGRVFVQLFDAALNAFFGQYPLCVHAPVCGAALALEYNGDLYTCDHFVEPDYLLDNIHAMPLSELVASPRQRAFGAAKRDRLTAQCRACDVRSLCHGGCPKDRFVPSRDGEPSHNYLCAGLYRFFSHVQPTMRLMAQMVQRGYYADGIMAHVAAEDAKRGRNDPCPCRSGRKFKRCHGGAG